MNGITALLKETPVSSLALPPREDTHRKKSATLKKALDYQSGTLILDFQN